MTYPVATPGQPISGQLMRFLCVGGSAAGIYFAMVHVLTNRVKLPVMLSISVGYICSVIFHFLANRRYTFGQTGYWSAIQLLRYMTVAILNYVLTIVVVSLLTQKTTIGLNLALTCAILTTTSFGFLASRYWIFRFSRRFHE